MRSVALLCALVALLLSGPAAAVPPDYRLRVEAVTDFPADVGGRLTAELPWRLRASTSLGFLPGGYVNAINAVVVAAGGYGQSTADLISAALQNSLIWRLHVGWRPFARFGFYFETGYGLVTLGGSATGEQILSAATGQAVPVGLPGNEYRVRSTLHMIDVELGWEWSVWRNRISLRAAIGGAFTVGAATTVDPTFATGLVGGRLVEGFTSFASRYLDKTYKSYVHTPVITVGAGYRFF